MKFRRFPAMRAQALFTVAFQDGAVTGVAAILKERVFRLIYHRLEIAHFLLFLYIFFLF